ncbi:MAG: exodeoxyribonuclease VII large subunit [Muribaculaceae bacterium]|nr:exodeoxyribonuclease VII large subunit [Muribaculaceae bacterium]
MQSNRPNDTPPRPMTLLTFTQGVSNVINSHPYLKDCWVVAELADFNKKGAHAYGQLIEKNAAGETVARINATIWASNLSQISQKFAAATGSPIAYGMKLLLKVSASCNPLYGLSANITDIDPSYTLGDMERLRREILEQLKKEGIIDANKRMAMPAAPQRIAIVSSDGAAGYGDFMNQLLASGFAFYPLLYQATLQGERTVPSIMAALDRIEEHSDFWDCVVIIRGGGATSDLNAFDNLELARRVALFPLPVIVGIGHERDNTVLDYIAHTRCKTPTAVAAYLIDSLTRAGQRADELTRAIVERTRSHAAGENQRLAHLAAMIPALAPARINAEKHRLDRLSALLSGAAQNGLTRAGNRLADIVSRIAGGSSSLLASQRTMLEAIPQKIGNAAAQRLLLEQRHLQSLAGMVDVLSPTATLRRGYSITRIGRKAVRSVEQLPPGTTMETILPDGSVQSITITPSE